MKAILWTNHVLITLFAITSGIFKATGGQADVDLFAKIGMTAGVVALFGVVQACGGFALLFARTSRAGAVTVASCNTLATIGLFAAGVVPFGFVSILFIVMALVELRLSGGGILARPVVRTRTPAVA